MQPNYLNLEQIDPRLGDRYCPGLHSFLAEPRNHLYARNAHVYRDFEGELWLGLVDSGYLCGAKLMDVLCDGAKTRLAIQAVSQLEPTLVDGFWARYVKDGRGAIHAEYGEMVVGHDIAAAAA